MCGKTATTSASAQAAEPPGDRPQMICWAQGISINIVEKYVGGRNGIMNWNMLKCAKICQNLSIFNVILNYVCNSGMDRRPSCIVWAPPKLIELDKHCLIVFGFYWLCILARKIIGWIHVCNQQPFVLVTWNTSPGCYFLFSFFCF